MLLSILDNLHRRHGTRPLWTDAKDRCDDEVRHRQEAENRDGQHDIEHLTLILVARRPKVNQNDADAVECVKKHRANQRERDEAYGPEAEDADGIVIDSWAKANERNIHDVDQQKEQD